MKAQILSRPRSVESLPLEAVVLPDPHAGPGELLLRVTGCAVCHTDLQLVEGDLEARRLPIVPGHQVVGRVEAIGSDVSGWAVGDRAGVAWLAGACGRCDNCQSDHENLCEVARFTGWDSDGGFCELIAADARFVLPLPPGFADEDAAPLLCGGVIGYRALLISGINPGQRLGLYGFGASASLAIQVAVHWGCEVFVATRSEHEQQRSLELGARWAGGYEAQPPAPLDAAVTFAPAGDVVVAALRAVGRGGTVAINAIHLDRVPEFPYELLWWERSLRSVSNFTRRDAVEFLTLAAEIPLQTHIERFPLAQANIALRQLARGAGSGTAVLIP